MPKIAQNHGCKHGNMFQLKKFLYCRNFYPYLQKSPEIRAIRHNAQEVIRQQTCAQTIKKPIFC